MLWEKVINHHEHLCYIYFQKKKPHYFFQYTFYIIYINHRRVIFQIEIKRSYILSILLNMIIDRISDVNKTRKRTLLLLCRIMSKSGMRWYGKTIDSSMPMVVSFNCRHCKENGNNYKWGTSGTLFCLITTYIYFYISNKPVFRIHRSTALYRSYWLI